MKRSRAPTDLAIGVDLGGTHVLAILMDTGGNVYARHGKGLTSDGRGSQEAIGSALRECIAAVHSYARDHHPDALPLSGVGIAVPGNVDPLRGFARYLPNFGWLKPVDLTELVLDRASNDGESTLRDRLHVDCLHMRNDGRCAALAERHFGVGASGDHSVIAMLTLGTGIGGALLHDPSPTARGTIFDGATFDAGDFGHHVICSGTDAFQCVCGKRGCFECHASAAGLVRHWRKAGGDDKLISLDDAKGVVDRMRDGDATAVAAFKSYKADLGTGLANLATFYNPSLIVLGGGLSRTPEIYDGLVEAVDAATLPATRGACKIVQSALGSDCAAMGAAYLVLAEKHRAHDAKARTAATSEAASATGRVADAIVAVGLTCIDSTMVVTQQPVPDTKSVAQRSLTCGGGNAANSAAAASRLREPGAPRVRLVTKLGSDAHGDALLSELARDEIDTRWAVRAGVGHRTPSSVIIVSGSSRTIVHDPGLMQSSPLLPAEFDPSSTGTTTGSRPEWLDGAGLVHLDGRHPAAAAHAARCARAAGVPVVLDVERPRPGLEDLLTLADYVVSSADFAQKLAAEESQSGASKALGVGDQDLQKVEYVLSKCPKARWVCVTLGAEGSITLERGKRLDEALRIPASPLPFGGSVRDTTGAGDAFIGALLNGLRRGLALEANLRVASYVAAANCTADGARGGMPLYSDLPPDIRQVLRERE